MWKTPQVLLVILASFPIFAQPGAETALTAPAGRSGTTPLASGDVINSAPNQGSEPLDCTVIDSTETLCVVGLFDGLCQQYDLSLVHLGTIPNPHGNNTHTAIAYVPDPGVGFDLLYWIDTLQGALIETDTSGAIQATFAILAPRGGLQGGICYTPSTDSLWVTDVIHDCYDRFTRSGSYTGVSFNNPDDVPPDSGAFGNGISKVPGEDCVDIPAGTFIQGQVSTLYRLGDLCGGLATTPAPVSLAGVPDTFINGVHGHATGSGLGAAPVWYVVGNASNVIFEVEAPSGCVLAFPCCAPPRNLTCECTDLGAV
ncbi:MAG: hypothetical protein V3T77_08710, partial [Planctomycetota bacterium]